MNRGRLLKPSTVELLQASQRLTSGEETGYGLGWYVKTVTLAGKQTRVIGHDGDSLGGMVASLMTVPELRDCRSGDVEHLLCRHVLPCGENCGGVCGPWRKSSDQLTRTSVPFVNHLQHAIRSRARFHTVRRPPCQTTSISRTSTHPSCGGKSAFPHLTETVNGEFDIIDTAAIAQNWGGELAIS